MVREVSESCVDSLLTEMVACYCNRFYANKPELAARRIEAIGYQVGHQLSERLFPVPDNIIKFLLCMIFVPSFVFQFLYCSWRSVLNNTIVLLTLDSLRNYTNNP